MRKREKKILREATGYSPNYKPYPSGLRLNSGTIGAIAELKVAEDLLLKGYEVFRAISPACSCDLAILKNKQLKRIEVRSGHIHPSGKIITSRYMKADILAIVIHKENKIVYEPTLS